MARATIEETKAFQGLMGISTERRTLTKTMKRMLSRITLTTDDAVVPVKLTTFVIKPKP